MKKLSEIKIKIKINLQKINLYFYVIAALITVVTLFFITTFLYKNFYQAITQSEIIISLQSVVAQETVDMVKFNKVMENINKKIDLREVASIKNPFIAGIKPAAEAEGVKE